MVDPLVCAIGEINLDLRYRVARVPEAGETLMATSLNTFLGGKAANCAVAVGRLGVPVALLGCIGDDPPGHYLDHLLRQEPIAQRLLITKPGASGTACILAEKTENRILVWPGVIFDLTIADALALRPYFDTLCLALVQPVIQPVVARRLAAEFRSAGIRLVVEPGPYPQDREWLDAWGHPYIFTPNIREAELYLDTKIDSISRARDACRELLGRADVVVLKMGDKGAMLGTLESVEHVPAEPAEVRDTAGAGDAFNGGMLAALAEGADLRQSVQFGCLCGAYSVGREGTSSSMPHRQDVPFPGD